MEANLLYVNIFLSLAKNEFACDIMPRPTWFCFTLLWGINISIIYKVYT